MMFGVAAIVISLTVSALAAIVIDTTYQAIAERRWPAGLSIMVVAVAILAGSALG